MKKFKLGISSCLLGENVRYNGMHKRNAFLVDVLGRYVEYVPVCPEVECGLGVPRESMRLVGTVDNPRLITHNTKTDHTDRMLKWTSNRIRELEKERLCGFIFKSKSPSSGIERVKVYNGRGGMAGTTSGLFAGEFMKHFPLLPVEDEGRLHDVNLRENFFERIFTLYRFRAEREAKKAKGRLVDFHARHKFLIMSHSPRHMREMGRLVAEAGTKPAQLFEEYEKFLLDALRLQATVPKHTNVLQHIMGFFKKNLTADEKQELLEIIEEYRQEIIPLIVPITLLTHYVRKYKVDYLADQAYLYPHPLELKLRNHA